MSFIFWTGVMIFIILFIANGGGGFFGWFKKK